MVKILKILFRSGKPWETDINKNAFGTAHQAYYPQPDTIQLTHHGPSYKMQ